MTANQPVIFGESPNLKEARIPRGVSIYLSSSQLEADCTKNLPPEYIAIVTIKYKNGDREITGILNNLDGMMALAIEEPGSSEFPFSVDYLIAETGSVYSPQIGDEAPRELMLREDRFTGIEERIELLAQSGTEVSITYSYIRPGSLETLVPEISK